jgi:hypothetical protein
MIGLFVREVSIFEGVIDKTFHLSDENTSCQKARSATAHASQKAT